MKDYYLDWYSEDYTENNWFNYQVTALGTNVPGPAIKYTPPKTSDQLTITTKAPDTARSILMNGTRHHPGGLPCFNTQVLPLRPHLLSRHF